MVGINALLFIRVLQMSQCGSVPIYVVFIRTIRIMSLFIQFSSRRNSDLRVEILLINKSHTSQAKEMDKYIYIYREKINTNSK